MVRMSSVLFGSNVVDVNKSKFLKRNGVSGMSLVSPSI